MRQKETSQKKDRAPAVEASAAAAAAGADSAGGASDSGGAADARANASAEESRNERERLAALNSDIGIALVQGDTLSETLHRCAEALVKHLGAAFARIWTLNEEENVLELRASVGLYRHLDGPHSRVPVGKFKIGLIAEERRPHLTNAVVGDPRVGDQEWAKREGMVAFAGYPLIVEENLVGVMAMFARHALSEADLQAMAAIANGVALGIKRKQAEGALRESEELNQAVLNSLTAHIAVLDGDGRIVAVNDAWRRFAEDNGEAAGRVGPGVNYLHACTQSAAVEGDDAGTVLAGIESVLKGARDSFAVEYACHSPTEERWFLLHANPLPRERGGAVVSHINITERKRAEETLARLSAEREAMLEEVSTPLVPVLEGVLVMPLIGSLDTTRMQRATQAALTEVRRTAARACVIDITGARIMDSAAVANLTNLVQSLRLVGAEAIITGVGADAARSIVGLGLDLRGLRTHRTLAQALAELMRDKKAVSY